MDMIIHTYGGGEILHKLFNSIAILMNNQSGGIARPMIVICASLASVWAITRAFFSPSIETLLGKYFFPILAVVAVFLIPSKTVRIEDAVTNKYYKIDHVPFLLAQFSQFASSLGYRMTKAIEDVMHVPNDARYNSTGMVFGAENAMDMSKFKIRNGDFERNLREFSKQCVFYDLSLGRYSIEDLQKTKDLWKFLGDKSSKVRMIDYIDPKTKTEKTITCLEAIKEMAPCLEKEKNYYALQDIGKNLPIAYQALSNLKEESNNLIDIKLVDASAPKVW